MLTKARRTQRLSATRVVDGARLAEASSAPLVQLAMHVDDVMGVRGQAVMVGQGVTLPPP